MDWQLVTQGGMGIVSAAKVEAERLGENNVSSEHLLLGLVTKNNTVATRVLDRLHISRDRIRAELEPKLPRGEGRSAEKMKLTPSGKHVLGLAHEEARQLGDQYIGAEHLLLGIIRDNKCTAGQVMASVGIDLDRARLAIREIVDSP